LDLPDVEGRKDILKIHAKGKPFSEKVDWQKVAKRTVGFSGADLENMLNEAAILAARGNKKNIDMADLEEAATKVKLGPEKRRLQSDEDRKMTAFHEGGHALVSWKMPHMDPVHRISIVSRGMSLGHTMMEPVDRVHETKTHLLEQITVMLGGRAAEELVFKEMTTGASDDIEKASNVARAMVEELGMSDLGPINLNPQPQTPYEQVSISPEMAAKIDAEINKIMEGCYKEAVKVLTTMRDTLDVIANELLKKETIEADDFVKLIGPKTTSAPAATA
jgi:cell division protease FtsH